MINTEISIYREEKDINLYITTDVNLITLHPKTRSQNCKYTYEIFEKYILIFNYNIVYSHVY
jgi:hypothetical protein